MGGKGFLGTNASLLSDITLVMSLSVAIILTIGVYMAIKKRFVIHRWLQTTAVVLNASLVLLVMIGSFAKSATPGIPEKIDQPYYYVALIHGLIGVVAFLFGSFVALRGNELVPTALKFNNYKRFMRIAYGLYMLATVLGVTVYVTWYGKAAAVTGGPTVSGNPNEQVVPMVNFVFNPGEIVVPVGTTINWVNNDPAPHTATADDGLVFDSGLLSSSQAFSFTFTTVGEFSYYCALHGSPGGVDMSGKIKVVPADQAPAVAVAAVVATATPQPTPHPLPAQFLGQPAGIAAFRDLQSHNDQLVLELKLAAAPPDGQTLQAFLTSADGSVAYPLGPLQTAAGANATLEFTAVAGENLLDRFSRIIVTQEPAGSSPAQPSGPALFESALPAQVLPAIRQLLVAGPGAPGQVGYAAQLRAQTDELLRHAQFIAQARTSGDTAAIARHAEHVFNLVSGSRDAQFGDRNGDGHAQNPGDGFGLLPNGEQAGYIQAAQASASAASQAPDATEAVTVHAGHVQVCTTNMQGWATTVRDLALALSQTTDVSAAGAQIDQLLALSTALSLGDDVNGDGHITPVPGECGAQVAYEHAQYMAGFGLFPVKP
jgi:plastocyanin